MTIEGQQVITLLLSGRRLLSYGLVFVAVLLACTQPASAITPTVAAGWLHSLALKADGTVVAWGHNASGQLGTGSTADRSSPAPVPGLADVVAIAAGSSHSLALKSDGTVLGKV